MTKVQIVAEIGSNWNPAAPYESCRAMIDAVAEAGADYVKFQDWHPLEQFDRPDWWKEKSGKWTLEPAALMEMRSYAQARGIGFITSVFTFQAVQRARHHDVIKVASSEVANQELLRQIAWTADSSAQIWLSLGEVESEHAVYTAIARLAHYQIQLLACVAEYPVARSLDLWDSFTFAQQWPLPLGVSSHIAHPYCRSMIQQLIRRGADVVEVHVRMRGVTPDDAPDNGPWSLWVDEFAELVEMIRGMGNKEKVRRDPSKEEWD